MFKQGKSYKLAYVFDIENKSECVFQVDENASNLINRKKNSEEPYLVEEKENKITYFEQGQLLVDFLNDNIKLSNNEIFNLIDCSDEEETRIELKNIINYIFDYQPNMYRYEHNFVEVFANNLPALNYGNDVQFLLARKLNKLKYRQPAYDIFLVDTLRDLLYVSLSNIVHLVRMPIRSCKSCGKYFIAKKQRNEVFCDNLYMNTGKTCKQNSSLILKINKLKSDEMYHLYRNIYDRKNKKAHRNPTNEKLNQEVAEWKIKAKAEYEKYKNKEISSEEFQSWLDNNN